MWQESVGLYSGGLSRARNHSEVRSEHTKRWTQEDVSDRTWLRDLGEHRSLPANNQKSLLLLDSPCELHALGAQSTQKSVTKQRAEGTQHRAGYSTHCNHKCDTKPAWAYHDMCWHSVRCFNFLAVSHLGITPPTCSTHIPTLQSPKYRQPPIKSKKAEGVQNRTWSWDSFPLLLKPYIPPQLLNTRSKVSDDLPERMALPHGATCWTRAIVCSGVSVNIFYDMAPCAYKSSSWTQICCLR